MPRKEVNASSAPSRLIYALGVAAILAAAIVLYAQFRGGRAPQVSASHAEGLGPVLIRQCTSCKKVFECSMDEARAKGYLDLEGIRLVDMGKKCPACGKDTLEIAQKCPHDGTVFIPDLSQGPDSKAARCPKCGWNPYPQ
ncbi:MAG: hypothetical protein ACPMAQ_09735 [Phycisphaerae bacterium]